MSEEIKVQKKQNKKMSNRKKLCYSIATLVIAAVLIVGLSFAWFFNKTDMATLMPIKEPSDIDILGPNGENMPSLNLKYDPNKDKNGDTVTIRRVICVQSAADKFDLEIVHTTNLKGLAFKLYPITDDKSGSESVTDSGYTYKYNSAELVGRYINIESSTNGYNYANSQYHGQHYSTGDKTQKHAEALYWKLDAKQLASKNNDTTITDENGDLKNVHRTYYVCEVTWTETTKETDIFYILAKTAE